MGFVFPNSQLPLWLGAMAVVTTALVIALRVLERRRRQRVDAFVEAGLASRLLVGYTAAIRRPLFWLVLVGFLLLELAMAQPKWGRLWEEVRKNSRDVLVVLDTSESMRATVPAPSRMERARQEIETLLERAPGDRFGLVAFSGDAELQCPLTLDHGYFRTVLNAIDTNSISREGTNIAAALQEAIKVFEEVDAVEQVYSRSSRAVVLISDGEQVSGDALAAAERLSEYAHVFVVGIGHPHGVRVDMPDWMARGRNRPRETSHVSKLDEDTLMRIANTGGGGYVRSASNTQDSDFILAQLQQLSARTVSSDMRMRLVNRYQIPLFLALHLFLAEGAWWVAMPWIRRWRTARAERPAAEAEHA
jgi:Ca-activated chloride channel family protein